jgi:hypothetical protein
VNKILLTAWTGILACCLLAGCGCAKHGAAPTVTEPDAAQRALDETRQLARQMERHEKELAGLQAEAQPNCPRAQALAGTICKLSERICQIAQRQPDVAELAKRCAEAKKSCERNRVKVAVRCPMGF